MECTTQDGSDDIAVEVTYGSDLRAPAQVDCFVEQHRGVIEQLGHIKTTIGNVNLVNGQDIATLKEWLPAYPKLPRVTVHETVNRLALENPEADAMCDDTSQSALMSLKKQA